MDQVEIIIEAEAKEAVDIAVGCLRKHAAGEVDNVSIKTIAYKREKVDPPVYELPLIEVTGTAVVREGAQAGRRGFTVRIHAETNRVISFELKQAGTNES